MGGQAAERKDGADGTCTPSCCGVLTDAAPREVQRLTQLSSKAG